MPRWEHKRCGSIYRSKVPPDTCGFCVAQMISVTKFAEPGWRLIDRETPLSKHPRRRTRRSGITSAKRQRIYERDGWRCVECGCDNPEQLTLDHRIPRSKGGTDADENLQTMCWPCNQTKGSD